MANQKIFSSFIEICDPLQLFHFHSKRIKSIAQGKEAGSMGNGFYGFYGFNGFRGRLRRLS